MCKHAWPASPMSCSTNEPKTLTELFQEVIWLLLFDYQNLVIHVDRRCQSCNCQEWPGKHKLKTWRFYFVHWCLGVTNGKWKHANPDACWATKTQLKLEDKPPKPRQQKNTRFADLAGAEPFPMQGCEKFVLKPLGFDAESIWSSSLWWWFHDDSMTQSHLLTRSHSTRFSILVFPWSHSCCLWGFPCQCLPIL